MKFKASIVLLVPALTLGACSQNFDSDDEYVETSLPDNGDHDPEKDSKDPDPKDPPDKD